MKANRKVDLTFTDFLYAVVAGSAFQHFTPYQWGWEDLIILAALLVLADDWVLYHAQASRVRPTPRHFAIILLLDIIILLIWYSLARYGAIGPPGFIRFLFWLGGFYLVVAAGEMIFRKQTGRTILMYIDFFCSFALALWGGAVLYFHLTPHQWMVPLTLLGLGLIRIEAWRKIVFQSS